MKLFDKMMEDELKKNKTSAVGPSNETKPSRYYPEKNLPPVTVNGQSALLATGTPGGLTNIPGQEQYKKDPNWQPSQGSTGEINTTVDKPLVTYSPTYSPTNPGGVSVTNKNEVLMDAINQSGVSLQDLNITREDMASFGEDRQGFLDLYNTKLKERQNTLR